MAETAYQRQYRQEAIAAFEKQQSLLRHTVTTEHQTKGNECIFLVAGSGSATAVTRGVNGDIPTRPDDLTQNTCTLAEWHDIPERTNWNIFASQSDGRSIMQRTSMAVVNRKIDELINTQLATATVTWGAAAVPTLTLVTTAKTKLGNAFADDTGNDLFAQITPAFHGYLMGLNQFTSSDYIQMKPFEGVSTSKAFNWYGVNWIVNPTLPGVGTASATCFMYNKNAIGHAANVENMNTHVGYDEKNDKSWVRCSMFMGSKLLQNSGVVKMLANDSALS